MEPYHYNTSTTYNASITNTDGSDNTTKDSHNQLESCPPPLPTTSATTSTTKDPYYDDISSAESYPNHHNNHHQSPAITLPPPPPHLSAHHSSQDQWGSGQFPNNYSYYPPPQTSASFYQSPALTPDVPPPTSYNPPSHYDGNLYYPTPAPAVGSTFAGMSASYLDLVKNEIDEDDETRPVVTLDNKMLWQEFHQAGTEMIITKTGR